jgi:anti-sigma B factor antagonist
MELSERRIGDVVVVGVAGRLVPTSGDTRLSDKVISLGHQGYLRILIDLGGVSYMDSAGLGELIHAFATMKKVGGALKLLRVQRRLRELLVITKLVTVFETFDDETTAIASFAAAA